MSIRNRRLTLPGVALSTAALLAGCGDDDPSGPGNFPDVRGSWTGQYSVLTCTILSGSDPFFCQDVFYEGRSLILDLRLNQSGSRVSGVAEQGQLAGQVQGNVDEFAVLTLSGQLGVNEDATTTIEDWETILIGDSLIGSWVFQVDDNTDSGFGSALVDADLTLIDFSVPSYESCPVEIMMAQTDEVAGLLEAGDCQLEDESYYDVFSVDMATGDQIEIRMSSPEFNPALLIVDLDEAIVACSLPVASQICNRNTPDSVAAVALEAVVGETWVIVANAFRALDVGVYTLTTQALTASQAPDFTLQRAAYGERYGVALDAVAEALPAIQSDREGLERLFSRPGSRNRSVKPEDRGQGG